MAKDLILGSAGLQGFEEAFGRFLSARNLDDQLAPWLEEPDTIVEISLLNGATVLEFLRHTVGSAGYSDETAAFKAGEEGTHIWKSFPWWDNALWLPVAFNNPGGMDDDPTFFVGSCHSLIAELEELKRASPLRLGEVVPAYTEMRTDFLKFIRSDTELDLTTEDCIRWVWRALRDGAQLSIERNAPMWAGPD